MDTANSHALQILEDNEEDDFTLEDLRKYDPKRLIFWGLTVSFFSEAATFPMVIRSSYVHTLSFSFTIRL
jgi:hypothetical protein